MKKVMSITACIIVCSAAVLVGYIYLKSYSRVDIAAVTNNISDYRSIICAEYPQYEDYEIEPYYEGYVDTRSDIGYSQYYIDNFEDSSHVEIVITYNAKTNEIIDVVSKEYPTEQID